MDYDSCKKCKDSNNKEDSVKKQQLFPGRFPTGSSNGSQGRTPWPPQGSTGSGAQPGGRTDGRPPSGPPSGPSGRPPSGPPSGPQGMRQPPSPPPGFTPQMPRGEGRTGDGQVEFRGGQSSSRPGDFRRPRDFRGCMNRFTFIWLINGNSFWFYPVFVGRNAVEGFRWRRNRWEYERINLNRIIFHICF